MATKITNTRGHALEIAATGVVVEPDETVEVDDDLAAGLLDQPDNWQAAKAAKATKTTKRRSRP